MADSNTRIAKSEGRVATLTLVALVCLAVLFLLGMYTNLYLEFPEGANGWKVIGSDVVATLHMSLGSAFALATIGLLIAAILTRRASVIVFASLGLLASAAAVVGGTSFAGDQSNGNSFIMAVGFVVAFISYATVLYIRRKP
jgi:hypothetical protein